MKHEPTSGPTSAAKRTGSGLFGVSPFIARRYLFSHKSHNAINIISIISVCGVVLATAALVVTLSVFNGFRDMVASFFTAFDPELKVAPVQGKAVAADDPLLAQLRAYDGIDTYTEVFESQALVVAGGRQLVVTIKGVDDSFARQTQIQSLLYGDGEFTLHADVLEYGVMGIRLANALGLSTYYEGGLPVYAPRPGERINMANPIQSFVQEELYSPGVVFVVNQGKYDANYIITSIGFARRLFQQQGMISAVELKLKPGVSVRQAKVQIGKMLGSNYSVQDRYEQQEDVFRIMQVEKLIAYLFLSFILLVACFNIIGSLSMLIIDKKADMQTLRALGANHSQVSRIFLIEGWLISGLGAVVGILIGLGLCWLQQTYGFIKMGDSVGSFIIDAYPVSVHATDVVLIFFTVLIVSLLAVWWPVRRITRNLV